MTTPVLDDLKRVYNRAWWALLLRGLLALTVGVFIFARPLDSVAAFALVIAWWALFSGFVNIAHAFHLKPVMKHWWVLLLSGLVGGGLPPHWSWHSPVPWRSRSRRTPRG